MPTEKGNDVEPWMGSDLEENVLPVHDVDDPIPEEYRRQREGERGVPRLEPGRKARLVDRGLERQRAFRGSSP